MRRVALVGAVAVALALAGLASPAAFAAEPTTGTTGTNPLEEPFAPREGPGKSERERANAIEYQISGIF